MVLLHKNVYVSFHSSSHNQIVTGHVACLQAKLSLSQLILAKLTYLLDTDANTVYWNSTFYVANQTCVCVCANVTVSGAFLVLQCIYVFNEDLCLGAHIVVNTVFWCVCVPLKKRGGVIHTLYWGCIITIDACMYVHIWCHERNIEGGKCALQWHRE